VESGEGCHLNKGNPRPEKKKKSAKKRQCERENDPFFLIFEGKKGKKEK